MILKRTEAGVVSKPTSNPSAHTQARVIFIAISCVAARLQRTDLTKLGGVIVKSLGDTSRPAFTPWKRHRASQWGHWHAARIS